MTHRAEGVSEQGLAQTGRASKVIEVLGFTVGAGASRNRSCTFISAIAGRRTLLKVASVLVIAILLFTSSSGSEEIQQTARTLANSPFSVPVLVNNNQTNDQTHPVIARTPTGALAVVWQDARSGNEDVYFARSIDNGTTFPANTRVDDSLATSSQKEPAMAISTNGTIFVVWQDNRRNAYDYDIYLSKTYNGGAKFTRNVKVDDSNSTVSWQERPSITVMTGGLVYVAWTDDRSGLLRVRGAYSTDFGATFSPSMEIASSSGTSGQTDVALTSYGNRIFATFIDNVSGTPHPYVAVSTNGGKSFGAPTRLDSSGTPGAVQRGLAVASIPGGYIVAVWEDVRSGHWAVYASIVSSHGAVLNSDIRVSDVSSSDQMFASVASDPLGNVFAAWTDCRNGLSSCVRLAWMEAGNVTFSPSIVPYLPGAQDFQRIPSIVLTDPGRVIAVWQDDKARSYDVYASSGTIQGMFGLSVNNGWNLISIPSSGYSYNASTLGLKNGSIVTEWNSTTQTYTRTYVVGSSLPMSDFLLSPSTGYWVYSPSHQRINLKGSVPSAKQMKKIVVPEGGGWGAVGFESFNTSRYASDIPKMLDAQGNVTVVTSYDPVSGTFSNYVTGKPFTDYPLVPGQAYWCFCTSNVTLSYLP